MIATSPTANLLLPPDSFYWAVLQAPRTLRLRRTNAKRLGWIFEDTLPVELERLHAIYVPLVDGRFLACAIDRDRLRDVPSDVLALRPDALPDFIDAGVDPATLNLLVGEFEPTSIRMARRRLVAIAAVAIWLVIAILVIGLERRARHDRVAAAALDEVRERTLEQSFDNAAVQPEVALLAELRTLRQTRIQPRDRLAHFNAAEAFTTLLQAWPRQTGIRIESISVTFSSIQIAGVAEESRSADSLAGSLRALESWSLQQPRFETNQVGAAFSLQLTPKEVQP